MMIQFTEHVVEEKRHFKTFEKDLETLLPFIPILSSLTQICNREIWELRLIITQSVVGDQI